MIQGRHKGAIAATTAAHAALALARELCALGEALETTPYRGGADRPAPRARPCGFPAPARRAAALQTEAARVLRIERARLLRAARSLGIRYEPMQVSVGSVTVALQVAGLAKRLEPDPRAARLLEATAAVLVEVCTAVRGVGGPAPVTAVQPSVEAVAEAVADLRRQAALLTADEAAARVGVSAACIRVAGHRGRLTIAGRRRGRPLFDPAQIDALWPRAASRPGDATPAA